MGQLIANILFSASTIFLVGMSFSLVFSTARFFHFAHAAVITSGAYACFAFSKWLTFPMVASVPFAIAVGTGLGWSLELAVYRTIRRRGASPLILLLASLGLYIVLQNSISMLFGDDTKVVSGSAVASTVGILGARITGIQLAVMGFAIAVFLAKVSLVDKTRAGLALRAVADNPELAKVSGIEFDKTMAIAFCFGSFLASGVGLSRAFDVGMTPTMGLPMLLLGVVAVVLGGNGKALGVAVASVLLASFQQISGWQFGTHWEETTAFLLLLAFLLCRPQGILGKKLVKASV
ncbi:MAG: branched-chain amino acid ABC transporter permease [Sedimentisphaerales bacterium]|nr:branched-chain amino acid ABC transporter permease [Sedimentisphaerales bacterium]